MAEDKVLMTRIKEHIDNATIHTPPTTNHALLMNLAYATAGHTGFQSSIIGTDTRLLFFDGNNNPAAATALYFIKATGRLGIGTSTPTSLMEIKGAGCKYYLNRAANTSTTISGFYWRSTADAFEGCIGRRDNNGNLVIFTNDSGATPKLEISNAGTFDFQTNPIKTTGRISSGTTTITSANDGTIAVGNINNIFIDASTADVTINDFTGGVNGQVIHLVVKTPDASNTVTITDTSGSNQELYTHSEADYVFTVTERGGFTFICNGSDWYDVSHAKHV